MASIYNISEWDEDYSDTYGDYKVHDIVKYGDAFWYCIKAHTSATADFPEIGSENWDGQTNIPINNVQQAWPHFFWVPSFNLSVSHNPKLLSISFGDGYEQTMPDGTNHDRLQFDLTFEKRSEEEAAAILHFLSTMQGYKAFYFKTPQPYGIYKKFICKSWSSQLVFEGNHSVSVSLMEKS